MARITTQVGRQKIENPNLGFDVEDGGVELHDKLTMMFKLFSDNIVSKWSGSVTLLKSPDTGCDVDFTHNFGVSLANLKLVFVIGGVVQSAAQVAAKFTITETSTNTVHIANTDTVNSVIFECYAWAVRLNVQAADVEAGFMATLATLTGAQTLTSKTLSQTLIAEESEPATPEAGRLAVFANGLSLWMKDSTGLARKVGSGSGAGLKNWVKNPDAETSRTADITFGAGVTAPTDAPTALVGAKSFRLTGAATAGVTTYWQWTLDTIESFYAGRPLVFSVKTSATVASAFKVAIYNITDSTEVSSTIVNVPAGTYVAKGFFLPVSGKSYGVRITQLTNGTNTVDVDDVFVGETSLQYGQSISDYVAFTPTGGWTTNTTYTGWWRRVGDSLEVTGKVLLSGAPTGTDLTINLPNGLTVDTSKMPANAGSAMRVGIGTMIDYGVSYYAMSVLFIPNSPTSVVLGFHNAAGSYLNDVGVITPTTPVTWGAQDWFSFSFKVPIVGWSSNVQTADRSVEEYASNSNATTAASDTTSFAYGPGGSSIPNGGTGTQYARKVLFPSAIQPTDRLFIEVNDGTGWAPIEHRIGGWTTQATTYYGARLAVTGTNDVLIAFEAGGYAPGGATFGSVGNPWSVLSAWKWRVRKVSGGGLVGFPLATSNLVGTSDGSVAGPGMFAELLETSLVTWTATGGTYSSSASFSPKTLGKGLWLCTLNVANRDIVTGNIVIWPTDSNGSSLLADVQTRMPPQNATNGSNDNQLTGIAMFVNVNAPITIDRFRCYNYDGSSRIISAKFQAVRIR